MQRIFPCRQLLARCSSGEAHSIIAIGHNAGTASLRDALPLSARLLGYGGHCITFAVMPLCKRVSSCNLAVVQKTFPCQQVLPCHCALIPLSTKTALYSSCCALLLHALGSCRRSVRLAVASSLRTLWAFCEWAPYQVNERAHEPPHHHHHDSECHRCVRRCNAFLRNKLDHPPHIRIVPWSQ